ncbi:MAG: hypothetical protein E7388_01755 [Ruminococcaceae bacterium]|nr:hypothetical protein [Oscillospiraceae bacterium]
MGYGSYFYEGDSAVAVGPFIGIFLFFYLLLCFSLVAFSVIAYIFQAKGMYAVASRRGLKSPWTAWIPYANMWLLGKIADDYCEKVEGKQTKYGKKLLGAMIGMTATLFFWTIYAVVCGVIIGLNDSGALTSGVSFIALMLPALLLVYASGIILYVFEYIALYKYFKSCQPSRAVLYLLLSIFIGVPLPFFVYSAGKHDEGMPEVIISEDGDIE